MLKSLPFQITMAVIIAFFFCPYIPLPALQFFLTISTIIKEILMAVLPIVIFTYIASALLGLEHRAPLLVLAIILLVVVSNAASVLTSYALGIKVLPLLAIDCKSILCTTGFKLLPLFKFSLPSLVNPEYAMLTGVTLGIGLRMITVKPLEQGILKARTWVNLFLNKAFIPVLPFYVFGFVLKMRYEGTLSSQLGEFGELFLVVYGFIVTYISSLYLIASGFNIKKMFSYIKTMLPAGITGFSTMSSAAAMPVTMKAMEKNTRNAPFAHLIVPTTVNIHMMGDALGIPLIGMAVLFFSGGALPPFEMYLSFVLYFCLAKFSAAGIPGGGVIVLLPVLQTHLGLTPEMTSLVATLYILQDPIFTGSNIMGNGAFALLIQKMCRTYGSKQCSVALAEEKS